MVSTLLRRRCLSTVRRTMEERWQERWQGLQSELAAQIEGGDLAKPGDVIELPEQYLREDDLVIPRSARQLVCPSGDLAPLHVVATPTMLALRREDGTVVGFENRCAHRGARLVEPGIKKLRGTGLACPYHGWLYDLGHGGRLKKAPRLTETPPGNVALRSIHADDRAGAIWLSESSSPSTSMDEVATAVESILEGPPLPSFRTKVFDVHANWKLCIESFLEGYHLQHLHKNSIAKVMPFPGAAAQIDLDRRNSASVVPLITFDPSKPLFTSSVGVFFIYPNAHISVSPRFLNFVTHDAVAVDRTVITATACARTDRHAPPDAADRAPTDFEQTIATLQEDYACIEGIQDGLSHHSTRKNRYTQHEALNVAFLNAVDEDLVEFVRSPPS